MLTQKKKSKFGCLELGYFGLENNQCFTQKYFSFFVSISDTEESNLNSSVLIVAVYCAPLIITDTIHKMNVDQQWLA